MNLDRVSMGDVPNQINVIIEIPAHSDPVKYELDKETGAMFVDRFMSTAMYYPCNYGYVPHTLSKDGDPVDFQSYVVLTGAKPESFVHVELTLSHNAMLRSSTM